MVNREAERKRLVGLLQIKSCWYNDCETGCDKCGNVGVSDTDIDKIADHLLDNGVVVPPCKVGDKLYTTLCYGIGDWRIRESTVYEVRQRFGTGLEIYEMIRRENGTYSYFRIELDSFGKTVFLTREDAVKALKGKEDEGK